MPERTTDDDRPNPMLHRLAAYETAPPSNVVRSALARLRHRRAGVATVNELFGAVASLVRGFAKILGADEPSNGGRRG